MVKVTERVSWVGVKDWDLRLFHGHELSTFNGSTYNSYLIKDEKTVLVDTVWPPHADQYLERLESEVGINNIDMIIINHMEPDHGGTLGKIMELRPDLPIYCSVKGQESIKAYFHKDWNFIPMKTGDTLNIGKNTITFVEMRMIHWPDSMLLYLSEDKIVISSDAFGQHFCTQSLFNDEVDECVLYQEAIKYYANILTPYSKVINRKLEELEKLNLNIEVIAPAHGVIWRKNPMQIIEAYKKWSGNYSEDYAVIIYDTMYDSTRKIALSLEQGLNNKGKKVKLFNASITDLSNLITEMYKADTLIIGSSTVNNGILASIEVLLHELGSHKLCNKDFMAFGSYGWSGESPKHIHQKLIDAKLNPLRDPVSVNYNPSAEALAEIVKIGEQLAK
ncbi:MAG: MBL fold metallo-hydrolase [Clostridia bacterium]|nr:MBL fold metallo-hydrolase [Clostridia bacterium]